MYVYSKSNNTENMIKKWNTVKGKKNKNIKNNIINMSINEYLYIF